MHSFSLYIFIACTVKHIVSIYEVFAYEGDTKPAYITFDHINCLMPKWDAYNRLKRGSLTWWKEIYATYRHSLMELCVADFSGASNFAHLFFSPNKC